MATMLTVSLADGGTQRVAGVQVARGLYVTRPRGGTGWTLVSHAGLVLGGPWARPVTELHRAARDLAALPAPWTSPHPGEVHHALANPRLHAQVHRVLDAVTAGAYEIS